jgi:hypothetical protein
MGRKTLKQGKNPESGSTGLTAWDLQKTEKGFAAKCLEEEESYLNCCQVTSVTLILLQHLIGTDIKHLIIIFHFEKQNL